MTRSHILLSIILCQSALLLGDHLVLRELSDYPLALCNDGTFATYHYTKDDIHNPKMLIYLQGGGLCASADSCEHRCTNTSFHCTAETAASMDKETTFWSQDPEENPPFHDFGKVYVHYCSSDVWSGTRTASAETNGYHFYGHHIVEAVVEDIIKHKPNVASMEQMVLIGTSAGAFGVNLNCDYVADKFHAVNAGLDIRCIADSADFYPPWVHTEGCNPYEMAAMTNEFWKGVADESCMEEVQEGSLECFMFPSYYNYIDTPFMVAGRYIDKTVHGPCTPSLNHDTDFWNNWQQEVYSMALTYMEDKPQNALFLLNCPGHVLAGNTYGWEKFELPILSGEDSILYKHLVKNWISGEGPYQAMDMPLEKNPKCNQLN